MNDKNDVFGGYTSIGWQGNINEDRQDNDDKAFIFVVRSCDNYPMEIFNAIKGKKTIRLQNHYYCMFGAEPAIWIYPYNHEADKGCCYGIEMFEKPSNRQYLIGEGSSTVHWWETKEIEVFQILANQ